MPISAHKSAAWKGVTTLSVHKSGAWKNVAQAWVHKSGAWKEIFVFDNAVVNTMLVTAGSVSPATATAGIKFDNDGSVYRFINSGYQPASYVWKTGPNAASAYEVRATPTGGTDMTPDGSAINTWLGLGSDRAWDIDSAGIGVEVTCELLIEIRMAAAPNTVLDSATVTLSALKDI